MASGLYYLHSFAATIFKYIQSKYASVNAVSKRGWPRGSPARSALGCREAQSTWFRGPGWVLGVCVLGLGWVGDRWGGQTPLPPSLRPPASGPGSLPPRSAAPVRAERCICSSQPNKQQRILFKPRIPTSRVTVLPSQQHCHQKLNNKKYA